VSSAGGGGGRRERRGRSAARRVAPPWTAPPEERGQGEGTSDLHHERLEAVARLLLREGAATVLDLGCGSGALLLRLSRETAFRRLTGIDPSLPALREAERLLGEARQGGARIELRHGSALSNAGAWPPSDAAVLVETIEHLPPKELSRLETALLAELRPRLVVITTPNRDCNALLGVPEGELRHPDHRFEWGRAKFEAWARGLALRHGYEAAFEGVGPGDAWRGRATQIAILRLAAT
jgi:small RNA 2'-O-methyltransferase